MITENFTRPENAASPGNRFEWRLKNDAGEGYIRRRQLDDDFFLTQSYLCSPQPFHSRFEPPTHSTAFVFMLRGSTRIRVAGYPSWVEMHAGEVCAYVDGGDLIRRETPAHQTMEALVVRVGDERLAGICSDLDLARPDGLRRGHVPLIRGNTPSTSVILEKIHHNRMSSATECLLAQAHAIDLICEIFLDRKAAIGNTENNRVRDLAAYIASDIGRDFSLSSLARMAGVNRTKLNRLFKNVHGCTVFEFIRQERLRRARQWLCQTDMPITDIAHAAGFCSSSHFCHYFHQVYGKPPRDFRLAPERKALNKIPPERLLKESI